MRTLLLVIIGLVGLTTMLLGLIMINYPDGNRLSLNPDLLSGSVFKDFSIPGSVFMIVGTFHIIGIFFTWANNIFQYQVTTAAGLIGSLWMVCAMIFIQATHWLLLTYFFAGLLIVLLSFQLRGKWLA